MLLADKVAIITGSTKGIGEAAATAMAKEGARVLVTGREKSAGEAVVESIRRAGGTAAFLEGDLLDKDSPTRLVKTAVQLWNRIDIVVNNAAMTCNKEVPLVMHEDWDRLFAVNVKSAFFLIQQALPYLLESHGSVINVSSINGIRNDKHNMVYDVMKTALNHMTSGFALDYRERGVRFNALLPGGVETPMLESWLKGKYPQPHQFQEVMDALRDSPSLAKPWQIANMIVLLASDRASWLNGAIIPLEGGFTLGQS